MGIDQRQSQILIVSNDRGLLDDFRHALRGADERDDIVTSAGADATLFGAAPSPVPDFEPNLVTCRHGTAAVAAMRNSLVEERPFEVAFIDLHAHPTADGIQTAEEIRRLDPYVEIVIVSSVPYLDPSEIARRVPPCEKVLFLQKPFHAHEVQQLAISLSARWQSQRLYTVPRDDRAAGAALAMPGLANALNSVPGGVAVFGSDRRLQSSNPELIRIFPWLADKLVRGASYDDIEVEIASAVILNGDDDEGHEAGAPGGLLTPTPEGAVVELQLPGPRWVLAVSRIAESGEIHNLFLDVTRLRLPAAEQIFQDRLDDSARLLASLSDSFGIREGKRESKISSLAAKAIPLRRASDHGADPGHQWKSIAPLLMSRKLQAVARRQTLNREIVNLGDVLKTVGGRIEEDGGAPIRMEIAAGLGLWPVHVDPRLLEETILELISNARDASDLNGRVVLETSNVRKTELSGERLAKLPAGEHVCFSIRDFGDGMSPEDLEQAPSLFFTTKGDDGHSGLGLSAAYGFVRQSGGYMRIDSSTASGTTVELYFPRATPGADVTPYDSRDNVKKLDEIGKTGR